VSANFILHAYFVGLSLTKVHFLEW